jgi:aspartate/methionine/tyrosine aminotransferase
VIAPADQAEALRRVQSYTTVIAPGPSVVLGRAVLAHVDAARAWVLAALAKNRERFARLGGWPTAGTTAFVRVRPKGNGRAVVPDTGELCRALLKQHGVAVVPGEFFGEPSGFRVGFGSDRRTFAEGWAIVRGFLKEHGLAAVR